MIIYHKPVKIKSPCYTSCIIQDGCTNECAAFLAWLKIKKSEK